MQRKAISFVALLATVLLLVPGLWAQSGNNPAAKTLTIMITGKLGPILSGSDPLGVNGDSGSVTVQASESLTPIKHTTNSATYSLPAGAVTVKFGSNKFTTTSKSTMKVKLTSTADILTLSATGPDSLQVTAEAYLQPKSWTSAVLKHPAKFTPSSQTLTAAKKAGGPGSQVSYTIFGETTDLGLTGSASNSDVDDLFFDEE